MDVASYNIATINLNAISSETKLNALRTFARTLDLDIMFLQEVESDQLMIPGYTVICNVDHSRRGTAIALKEYIQFSNVERSLDSRLLALRISNVTLVCIYAPSGTQFRAERERFFNNTVAYYLRHNPQNVILAGDFNCVLRQCDATGPNASPSLSATVQQLLLRDVWIKLCPRIPGHTYITANSTSRLDRIYVSDGLCQHLRSTDTHVCSFSDHKALTARICLPQLGREPGRGFWCLRPHLLTTENMEEFQQRWQYWTRQRRNYSSWMCWWITYAKPKIKSFYKWKSRIAYNEFNREHQRLYEQLKQAYDRYYQDPSILQTINRIKGQMLTLQRNFTKMFTKINETYIAGEALSSFQLGERRKKRTTISRLRVDEGETLDRSSDIEQHLLQYFQQLYAADDEGEPNENDFECERVVPENDGINEACMSEISTTEILTAIRTSASRKSPGSDGIPKEFYIRSFDIIHRELNLIMNEALTGNFSPAFVDGVIVLVKKRGTDETARSYRPISLLNFDYKILSRILKARLENVVRAHQILSHGQKCSNPNRNIFQATLSLKDRIARVIQRKQRAKVIAFDFDHAFDRVRLSFLYRTMCSLGINRDLVNLLNRISSCSSSRLLVNGHLSPTFPIQRSVRQGCPLSMLLFVIYLHPLLSRLERICNEDLIVAYADDITAICTSVEKIEQMRTTFNSFELVSGAKINWQKTKSLDVGYIEGNPLRVDWLQTVNTLKILGIIFTNSIRLMTTLNWDSIVTKFSQQIFLHAQRSLTLHQKVTLLNTFVTSKIWYLSSILSPYSVHVGKITATIGTFLWSRVPARVPLQQLARDYAAGGLKLQLPALKCRSLILNRFIREIESMPFYQSILPQDDQNRVTIPADLPDLRGICQHIRLLPPLTRENPSSDGIHKFYLEQIEAPKVERENPNLNWKRVWMCINSRKFSSSTRSDLFMIINRKVEHRKLFYQIGRTDNESCTHCNALVETIEHKFSECPNVRAAWELLQMKLTTMLHGRRLSFGNLIRPSLENISLTSRIKLLKLFAKYIIYVNTFNNRIDVAELEFLLDTEE